MILKDPGVECRYVGCSANQQAASPIAVTTGQAQRIDLMTDIRGGLGRLQAFPDHFYDGGLSSGCGVSPL